MAEHASVFDEIDDKVEARAVAEAEVEIDAGKGIPHEGNYTSFVAVQDKRLLQEGKEEEARERTLAREREFPLLCTMEPD